uniref:ANK_REP_REGION domain-containing protein n=1 Tax=Heterorhabditis bacteriophora TaxID=37862 RepID=A0A1I7WZU9_HETBA
MDVGLYSCSNKKHRHCLQTAIHYEDVNLVERLLVAHNSKQPMSTSPSIGSTNTLTELAQRRHGAGAHRRSNASSTVSTHSGGRSISTRIFGGGSVMLWDEFSAMGLVDLAFVLTKMNSADCQDVLGHRLVPYLQRFPGYNDVNTMDWSSCSLELNPTGNLWAILVCRIPVDNRQTHSMTPELCSTCSQLRVVSIVDQTPLGVAVRAQSSELIALLIAYGADVNMGDEDGNTPLMLAVRESPLSWPCLHTLIFFGAQIEQKNMRGICPLDLAPELKKLQQTCVEELFKNACSGDSEPPSRTTPGPMAKHWNRLQVDNGKSTLIPSKYTNFMSFMDVTSSCCLFPLVTFMLSRTHGVKVQYQASSFMSVIIIMLNQNSILVSQGERSLSKTPLSPKPSAAPSVSTCSMLETSSAKESARRKSLVSLQLHRKTKNPKECAYITYSYFNVYLTIFTSLLSADPVIDCVNWEQAWELLKKMASNPECLENIVVSLGSLSKFSAQMENTSSSIDREMFDAHMGGLLHKMIHTAIEGYESSTPTYKKQKKLHLTWLLSQMTTFCYSFLQKSGTSRQFSALNTLNKVNSSLSRMLLEIIIYLLSIFKVLINFIQIMDAGLVHDLFSFNDVVFHSSRILNRSHAFDSDDPPSPCESFVSNGDQNSTVDHVFIYGAGYKDHSVLPSPTHAPVRHKADLMDSFSEMDPSQVIVSLHNAITMQNREAGSRSVCSPAHRWRQCCAHCTQILVARLLLFLTHSRRFRSRLSDRHQLRSLVALLEPTLEPQLLCLLLQCLALIALDPSTHSTFVDVQIDDVLIQMLLPADDWYYTNHSTKYGFFVKYHAARVLVYVGMGDRVGSRVNLFTITGFEPGSSQGKGATHPNEDDYICETCATPRNMSTFSRSAMSVEGILLRVLAEVAELVKQSQHLSASEPITEESPSAGSPPAIEHNEAEQKRILETNEEKLNQLNCQILISLEQLEAHLCKLGLVLDSVLLLRLLLHKLSWDLGLVSKKRVAVVDQVHKTITDPRAHSSCSLGGNIRLGTDTSSGSNRSKKTTSSSSSVQKHLPKYIQSLFRGRMGTDPCKRHSRRDSNESNTSGSDAVLEFTRKLQNYPLTRRDAQRQTYRSNGHQDSNDSKAKQMGYSYLPELEIQGASPPRFTAVKTSVHMSPGPLSGNSLEEGAPMLFDARRPSSPQAIPGLPLIEIRRPSALSQFEFGYFVNSPELSGSEVSDCAPLLLTGSGTQMGSRKSSDGMKQILFYKIRHNLFFIDFLK